VFIILGIQKLKLSDLVAYGEGDLYDASGLG